MQMMKRVRNKPCKQITSDSTNCLVVRPTKQLPQVVTEWPLIERIHIITQVVDIIDPFDPQFNVHLFSQTAAAIDNN